MKKDDLGNLSVKEKLIQVGLDLFSEYGYDATSTRMIAKVSGITRSSIAFYFETKEAFYQTVLERAEENLNNYLDPLYTQIMEEYNQNSITPETARCYIFRILKNQIIWYSEKEFATTVKLITREHTSKEQSTAFYDILYEKLFNLLARLIMTNTGLTDHGQALMLSFCLNGNYQASGEHKGLTRKMFDLSGDPEKNGDYLDRLTNMVLDNTRVILDYMKQQNSHL